MATGCAWEMDLELSGICWHCKYNRSQGPSATLTTDTVVLWKLGKLYAPMSRIYSPLSSVVARSNDILKKLVLEAKKEYEKDTEHRVHIFMADTSVQLHSRSMNPFHSSDLLPRTYSCWRWNGSRQKRPMSSIVLQPGVKDMLLADCKDFLCSEEWYVSCRQDLPLYQPF
jgi:hypothetical protein